MHDCIQQSVLAAQGQGTYAAEWSGEGGKKKKAKLAGRNILMWRAFDRATRSAVLVSFSGSGVRLFLAADDPDLHRLGGYEAEWVDV